MTGKNHLPSTESKHANQTLLLTPADLKTSNDPDRETEDNYILPDVQARRTIPHNVIIHTFSLVGFVPEEVDWVAHKNITEYSPGTTRYNYAQHSIASAAEVTWWKDSNILNEYRHFDRGKCKVVNPHAGPEHLCS